MIGTIICPSCDTATEVSEAHLANFRQEGSSECSSCGADLTARMRDLMDRHEGPSVTTVTDDVPDEDAFAGLPTVGGLEDVSSEEVTAPATPAPAAADAPAFPAPPSTSGAGLGGTSVAGAAPLASEPMQGVVPPEMASADTVPEEPVAPPPVTPEAELAASQPTPVVNPPGEGTPRIDSTADGEVTVSEPTEPSATIPTSAPAGEVTVPSQSASVVRPARMLAPTSGARIGLLGIRVVHRRPKVRPAGANGHAIPAPDDTVISAEKTVASAPANPVASDETVASAPVPQELAADTANEATIPEESIADAPTSPGAAPPVAPPAGDPTPAPSASSGAQPLATTPAAPDEAVTQPPKQPSPDAMAETQKVPTADPLQTQKAPVIEPAGAGANGGTPPPSPVAASVAATRTPGKTPISDPSMSTVRPPSKPPTPATTQTRPSKPITPPKTRKPSNVPWGIIIGGGAPLVLVGIVAIIYITVFAPNNGKTTPTPTATEVATTPTATAEVTSSPPRPTPKPTRVVVDTPRPTQRATPKPTSTGPSNAQRLAQSKKQLDDAKKLRGAGRNAEALNMAKQAAKTYPQNGDASCTVVIWSGFKETRYVNHCKRYGKDATLKALVQAKFP